MHKNKLTINGCPTQNPKPTRIFSGYVYLGVIGLVMMVMKVKQIYVSNVTVARFTRYTVRQTIDWLILKE